MSASGPARRRRPRVPAHRQQHPGSPAREQGAGTPVPGNEPARGLRRRRCPQRVGQAGRDRDRGRLDGGAARLRTSPGHRERRYRPASRRHRSRARSRIVRTQLGRHGNDGSFGTI